MLASLCISYIMVATILIIDGGWERSALPICGCLDNVWEGVPKAAKKNRKLRSGLKSCRHRVEGAAEGQQCSCRYRRRLPTGAWLRLQLSSQIPTLTGAAGGSATVRESFDTDCHFRY